jgi:dTDP-4-dehydrorhamnose 3,5-epimerase
MINGVAIKKLVRHPDERGYFEELIRISDEFFNEGFGQLSHTFMAAGVVKAWHVHRIQIDWWFCATGKVKAVLYDGRKDSSTYRELNEYILGDDPDNMVLKIPAGVAHGMKVLEGPCHFIYVTSAVYNPEEEGRIAYDDKEIGYDWVQGMPITNTKIT